MDATGNLIEGVVFSFYEHETGENGEPVDLWVTELTVWELEPDKLREPRAIVWQIRGGQRLRSIEYGAEYIGLEELVPAQRLRSGARYEVRVQDSGNWLSTIPGSGMDVFGVDEGGQVTPDDPLTRDIKEPELIKLN